MGILPACTPAYQKASDFIGLQLQKVVSHHMVAGNLTQDLWKSS